MSSLPDGYTIERELGCGGMAVVYLAGDLKRAKKNGFPVERGSQYGHPHE